MMEQYKDCTLEEVIAFAAIEIEELKKDFDEMLIFVQKRQRLPLRLMRRTRVKTVGIEKLVALFRKKSVDYKKEVKEKKDAIKASREAKDLLNLKVKQQELPALQTDLLQKAPTPQAEVFSTIGK
jgi:hypothetical protein